VEVDGVPQPAPAPRFSATPAALDRPPALAGEHTDEVLVDCGFSAAEVAELRGDGVLG
jgi:alpha-methylacyl-CoA racemase